MAHELTRDGGTVIAEVSGEFDMAATFQVEPALERALDAPDVDRFTLDLSRLTFIDSTGLGVVMRLAGELEERDVAMHIVPGPPEVQRVFESVGLADALPFAPAPEKE